MICIKLYMVNFIEIITAYEKNQEVIELTHKTIKIVDYEEKFKRVSISITSYTR